MPMIADCKLLHRVQTPFTAVAVISAVCCRRVALLSALKCNFCSLITQYYSHKSVEFLTFPSPNELGEPSRTVNIARRRFFREFWASHGREHARNLAEARQAEVCSFRVLPLPFSCLFCGRNSCVLSGCVSGEEA
ncbi:hypothetical protein SORBI_3006G208700 [Sorghum bicolor]|uniref:Uncharacterized protein n=1 Tax=Sorghum bicolor TaxID=4558 RepID=A0A1Z5REW0_SORBI|nr:hypothetical protein SORBI_3006G208700 [Sorghum bicolor]